MKTGHDAMLEYDQTWKRLFLPKWFKDAIRRDKTMLAKPGVFQSLGGYRVKGFHFLPLVKFDHVGCIKRGEFWIVITSPYEPNDGGAKEMARRLRCELEITNPSPYHPNAVMYAFVPSDLTMGRVG